MRITKETLSAITGRPGAVFSDEFVDALHETLDRYEINTPLRVSHFLAQVCHESGGFRWNEEIWGPTPHQERYEGRADLGNTVIGDGYRFRGRGFIQLTGRSNYLEYSRDRGVDFAAEPDKVAEMPYAIDVAGWFWDTRHINGLADADAAREVTRRINGGSNGLADRMKYLRVAKALLMPQGMAPKPPENMPTPSMEMALRQVKPPADFVFDSKPLWASKRVLGWLMTVLGVFGAGYAPVGKALLEHYDGIIVAVGLIVNLYGSLVAKKRLRLWPEKKG